MVARGFGLSVPAVAANPADLLASLYEGQPTTNFACIFLRVATCRRQPLEGRRHAAYRRLTLQVCERFVQPICWTVQKVGYASCWVINDGFGFRTLLFLTKCLSLRCDDCVL